MTAANLGPAQISAVRLARLARLRRQMATDDIGCLVLVDPVNIRYATDARNMQVYTARNPARYVFIAADGPVVLFEFAGCAHIFAGLETIDEIRIAKTVSFVAAAQNLADVTRAWADEIDDLIRAHAGGNKRVGLERFNADAVLALADRGYEIVDAQGPVERARAIKVPHEIDMMRASMAVVEAGVAALRDVIEPGVTENQVWSELWRHVIAAGGDYVETRLLNSGPRTNPWFQESSDRVIAAGELVCLDTDTLGQHGYYADFSRTWLCGDRTPTPDQRNLYRLAYEQVHANLDLLKPGIGFRELSERGWVIPDTYEAHRYYLLAHGVGMTGEYPLIVYAKDYADAGYDGVVEPGMVLCFESFIGGRDGGEGVKLEQQVAVTETGWELMSNFPFDETLLGREI